MSSAAVLTVYAAGYIRTRPAANRVAYDKFIEQAAPQQPDREPVPPPAPARPSAISPAPTAPGHAEAKKAVAVTKQISSDALKIPAPASKAEQAVAPPTAGEPVTAAAANSTEASTQVTQPQQAEALPATSVAPAATVASDVSATPAATAPTPPPAPVWKDGKYTAWGTCQHGDIEATVVIEGGKIVSADISNCQTRYSCDVIENLPAKVVTRQKAKFDRVGGATESAYAYYGAVYWALDKASK